MSRVIAYHLILTRYGFWLPNDERGSGSHHVWSDAIKPFGPATHVDSQHSVAHVPHDKAKRKRAKQALKHPPVRFTGEQANVVVHTFGAYLRNHKITCWACAMMPDHAHLVLRRHEAGCFGVLALSCRDAYRRWQRRLASRHGFEVASQR